MRNFTIYVNDNRVRLDGDIARIRLPENRAGLVTTVLYLLDLATGLPDRGEDKPEPCHDHKDDAKAYATAACDTFNGRPINLPKTDRFVALAALEVVGCLRRYQRRALPQDLVYSIDELDAALKKSGLL